MVTQAPLSSPRTPIRWASGHSHFTLDAGRRPLPARTPIRWANGHFHPAAAIATFGHKADRSGGRRADASESVAVMATFGHKANRNGISRSGLGLAYAAIATFGHKADGNSGDKAPSGRNGRMGAETAPSPASTGRAS